MKNYSFANTIALVNGFEITGWDQSDDSINITRRNDSAIDVVGNDGTMTVAVSPDKSGAFTFKLQQTSSSNTLLSGLVNGQENGLFVPIYAQFKDTQGGDLASGTAGYIKKHGDITRGRGVNIVTWEIIVERLDMLLA